VPALPINMITKITAVAPADKASCPLWLHFLDEATGGDPELTRLLQQWFGYCLTGSTQEHALMFIHGDGGNGKSVFLNTVAGIMGDYAVTAPMDAFTISTGDRHPADLAMLRGARLVAASETEQGRSWAIPYQATDWRRSDLGPLHVPGLVHLQTELQADDRRKPCADADQRRRCDEAPYQHRAVHPQAGTSRPDAGVQTAQGEA
jgi:hypothetical protein